MDISQTFQPYSGVEIIVDDETTIAYPTDDETRHTGRVLTIQNPWGTVEQAQNIYNSIKGFQYQPYTASKALLSPAAEIGDGVSINNVYSGIYKITRYYSSLMATDISAPQSEEIDHEYPFETKANRDIARKFSAVNSEINQWSDKIEAKVSKQSPAGQTSFSWELDDDSWEVKSNGNTIFKVDPNGAEVSGVIKARSGEIGAFKINYNNNNAITYNDIYWGCWERSGIYIGPQGIQVGKFHKPGDASSPADAAYIVMNASNGLIEAKDIRLRGKLYLQGKEYTAQKVYSGSVSGNVFGNATLSPSQSGYAPVSSLNVNKLAIWQGAIFSDGAGNAGHGYGLDIRWVLMTINGRQYYVLTGEDA